jgi:hypothetical protein
LKLQIHKFGFLGLSSTQIFSFAVQAFKAWANGLRVSAQCRGRHKLCLDLASFKKKKNQKFPTSSTLLQPKNSHQGISNYFLNEKTSVRKPNQISTRRERQNAGSTNVDCVYMEPERFKKKDKI